MKLSINKLVYFECNDLIYEGRVLSKFPGINRYYLLVDRPTKDKGMKLNIHADDIQVCRRKNSK